MRSLVGPGSPSFRAPVCLGTRSTGRCGGVTTSGSKPRRCGSAAPCCAIVHSTAGVCDSSSSTQCGTTSQPTISTPVTPKWDRDSPEPVTFRHRNLSRSSTITAHAEATTAAEAAATAIADKKGEDILLLDVSELVVVTDVFVIATGTSTRHVKTLVEEVEHQLKTGMERRVLRREGEDFGKWVLLDYGDVIVHVFDRETRDYYELERLWADAPATEIESATAEA